MKLSGSREGEWRTEVWGEALAHAALLFLFVFVWALFASTGAERAVDIAWRAAERSIVDGMFLALLLFFFSMVASRVFPVPSTSRLVIACCAALLYVFIVCQFRFRGETGTYFSWKLIVHAAMNFGETWKVIRGAAISISSVVALLFAAILIMIGRFAGPYLRRCAPLLAVPAIVLVVGTISPANELKRRLRSESALASLVGSPTKVFSGVPEYDAPALTRRPVAAPEGLNIVVVVLESTRARSVPLFAPEGAAVADMPNLVALASRSRIFRNTYTTTSHTSKALVGLLCGIHPSPEMKIVESLPGGVPVDCLPGILSDAGFESLFIQSATSNFENRPGLVSNLGYEKALYKEDIGAGFEGSGYFGLDEAALVSPFDAWWRENAGRPKFATILTSMSHHPYEVLRSRKEGVAGDAQASYLEVLNYVDEVLGKLLSVIEASGEAGRTIVVVTGDHGEAFGEHGPKQHDAVPFDEGTHVPLLVWDGRGQLDTGEDMQLRQHLDLFPTVVRLAGGGVSGGEGVDLFERTGHARVFTNCWYPGACIGAISGDMKWIYSVSGGLILAFNRAEDPYETKDLAAGFSKGQRDAIVVDLLLWQESVRRFHAGDAVDSAPGE